jgi:hypothetical protein
VNSVTRLIQRIQQQASVSHDFGDRSGTRRDYRRAAHHRLEERQSKPLIKRRIYQGGCAPIKRPEVPFSNRTQVNDGIGFAAAHREELEALADAEVRPDQNERQRRKRAEVPPGLEHGFYEHRQVPPFVQIADVQQVRRRNRHRQLHQWIRAAVRKTLVHAERRHRDAFGRDAVGRGDFRCREARHRQNVPGTLGASSIESAAQPVTTVWVPLRVQFIADIVNGDHDRNRRPPGSGVSRRMNDVDRRAASGTRQTDQRPAQIRRGVRRLRDVPDTTRDGTRITASQRHELDRLVERQ